MATDHRLTTRAAEPGFFPASGPESRFEPLRVGMRTHPIADLLEAFGLLAQRGSGGLPWAAPFRHDPIAFLLDSMGDAVNLWTAGGFLLHRNRAAEALDMGRDEEAPVQVLSVDGRSFERRCMRCHADGIEYMLEMIRELPRRQGRGPT
jgi:hypothetical protein